MAFMTHTEGGAWLQGPATTVTNCATGEVTQIRNAFTVLVSTGIPSVTGLGLGALAACLAGKTEASLSIDCRGPGCGGTTLVTGTAGGINFCGGAFASQAHVNAALFHACVLSCGGLEIDAWALENHCYAGPGTRAPNATERDGLLTTGTTNSGNNIRVGAFVTWDRTAGTVRVTSSGAALNVDTQAYKGPLQLTVGPSWP